ncbi:hypothetical protein ACFX12_006189 [Malus domestica]
MKDGRHILSGEGGTASSPRLVGGARHFQKCGKKEEIGQIKILEVQERSFYKRKFKCALKRTACLYKISTRRDFRDRRGELRIRRGQFKNQRGVSFLKSWACLETTGQSSFPDLSALVICNLCTRRSSEIEEANSKIKEASSEI